MTLINVKSLCIEEKVILRELFSSDDPEALNMVAAVLSMTGEDQEDVEDNTQPAPLAEEEDDLEDGEWSDDEYAVIKAYYENEDEEDLIALSDHLGLPLLFQQEQFMSANNSDYRRQDRHPLLASPRTETPHHAHHLSQRHHQDHHHQLQQQQQQQEEQRQGQERNDNQGHDHNDNTGNNDNNDSDDDSLEQEEEDEEVEDDDDDDDGDYDDRQHRRRLYRSRRPRSRPIEFSRRSPRQRQQQSSPPSKRVRKATTMAVSV